MKRLVALIALAVMFGTAAQAQNLRGQQMSAYDTLANTYYKEDSVYVGGSGLGTAEKLVRLDVANSPYSTGLLYVVLENDSTRVFTLPPGTAYPYGLHPATFVRCKPESGKTVIRIINGVRQ